MLYLIFSVGVAFLMSIGVIILRMKAQQYPVNEKKLILPPIFMSTGAVMYVIPYFRITGLEALEAMAVGLMFSIVLIWTSRFEIKGKEIYMKRSKAFPIILISLLVIRTVMKLVISSQIDPGQLGGMFFLLAFSMILPWRIAMLMKYKKLRKQIAD